VAPEPEPDDDEWNGANDLDDHQEGSPDDDGDD